jgi:hypothetical protein
MQFREKSQGRLAAVFGERFQCFSACGGDACSGVADEGRFGVLAAVRDGRGVGVIGL